MQEYKLIHPLSCRRESPSTTVMTLQLPWQSTPVVITRADVAAAIGVIACAVYFWFFNPAVLVVSGIGAVAAVSLALLNQSAQVLQGVRFWHLYGIVLGGTVVFGHFQGPAFAQFFNALEDAIIQVITDANTGIDDTLVSTIFVFFRILIVLAFIVGVIVAISQAARGNDWQSIANLLGIGVAFVLGVEVITQLILDGI